MPIGGAVDSHDTIELVNDQVGAFLDTVNHNPDIYTPLTTQPHFGMMPIATAVLGHTPTTVFYASYCEATNAQLIYSEILQYDVLVVSSGAAPL